MKHLHYCTDCGARYQCPDEVCKLPDCVPCDDHAMPEMDSWEDLVELEALMGGVE